MVGTPLTNSAVVVTNGLFTTTLNFGPGIFTGTNYWLEIAARTNGNSVFNTLSPRQPLTPTPYAIFANSASNLLGTLPPTLLSGTYPGAVTFNNGANNFSGNGAGLTGLNASQLATGTVPDARLTANVALLNTDQTFSGVNALTNDGNSFSGSFFGNGLVGWIAVPGTTQQAVRDTGYMLTSPFYTTVTLPTTASLIAGDIVRISGTGAGGWRVTQNSSQLITGNLAAYRNGYVSLLPAGNDFRSVAASADGVRMYAVNSSSTGAVNASSDSGQNWSSFDALNGFYVSVACSANGKIVYAEPSSGAIQKSTNSGATWAATGTAANGNSISCSADGSTLFVNNYACSGNGTYLGKMASGVITISTNGVQPSISLSLLPPLALLALAFPAIALVWWPASMAASSMPLQIEGRPGRL